MPYLFTFRYRKGYYLTSVIILSIFLFVGLLFGGLVYLLMFGLQKGNPDADLTGFILILILVWFPVMVLEIIFIIHAARKLGPQAYVLAGTAEGLYARNGLNRVFFFPWYQLASVRYISASTSLPNVNGHWSFTPHRVRRSYLHIYDSQGKSYRIDVSFMEGRIEDALACLRQSRPDLPIDWPGVAS